MIKKLVLIALCTLLALPSAAQKRRRTTTPKEPAVPYIEQARQALKAYRFEEAHELATKEIETLEKKKQSTDEVQLIARQAELGILALHATERIVIIDSLVCTKEQALAAIKLSSESGRIDTYASTYHTSDVMGATIYENDFANKRFIPVTTTGKAGMQLAVSHKIGDQWSAPVMLQGLNASDIRQNYPFMLSDGVTLYYAADGPESIGGYDIFVTRADDEDGTFLSPENLGFPFNSTANDYLLVIDEFAQLGWFVSDRNQPEGQVCVYTVIPNATRQTYQNLTEEALRERARIVSIKDTWKETGSDELAAARQRLDAQRNGTQSQQTGKAEFHFVIDDNRTYTTLAEFRSPEARQKMQQWLQLSKNTQTDEVMLQRLRDNYAATAPAQRAQLTDAITRLEATYYPQLEQLRQLAKEIRNAEIAFK